MALILNFAGLLLFIFSSTMSSDANEPNPGNSIYACQKLPSGENPSWAVLQQLLSKRKFLQLGQSWLATNDPQFMPSAVAAAWNEKYLYVYGDLEDRDIFNPSEGLNQPAYQKGDIFEILIKSPSREAYFEFHVTPHDQVMQLCFPRKTSLADYRESGGKPENLISTFKINERVVNTHAEIHLEENRWTVLLKIPASTIAPHRTFNVSDVLLFSFCRYDYTRGTDAPVLSSTSNYTVCSFHRQQEWRKMILTH